MQNELWLHSNNSVTLKLDIFNTLYAEADVQYGIPRVYLVEHTYTVQEPRGVKFIPLSTVKPSVTLQVLRKFRVYGRWCGFFSTVTYLYL